MIDSSKRIRLTVNLFLDEYIPREMYIQLQKKPHIMEGLLDPRLVKSDQMLRDHFGPVTINNWWMGGNRNESGIRTPDMKLFSFTSQHPHGRASDKIFSKVTAEDVRQYISKHWKELGITCIEGNVSWVHSDVRLWTQPTLLVVYP